MTNKTVLILCGTGLLGKALRESSPGDAEACSTHLRDLPKDFSLDRLVRLDVTDRESTIRLFQEIRPRAVVHLAGVGSVDFAEKNQRDAWAINVWGTLHVIDACRQFGVRLIYVSYNET